MGKAKVEREVPKYRKKKVRGKFAVECRWSRIWNEPESEPGWGEWRVWSRYKTAKDAEKALVGLQKQKHGFIQYRLGE
jgi:hypothetical protein